jgi:hypothetical protein
LQEFVIKYSGRNAPELMCYFPSDVDGVEAVIC